MHGRDDVPPLSDRKTFDNYWKPVLLPELVGKKKRPASYLSADSGDSAASRVRAESINWNTAYTEKIFPEDLRILRNSGALLRDWEETFEWIYLEYNWDRITEVLSGNIILEHIK
jgi:hypothetical protein